jgi:hypothetical protein
MDIAKTRKPFFLPWVFGWIFHQNPYEVFKEDLKKQNCIYAGSICLLLQQ